MAELSCELDKLNLEDPSPSTEQEPSPEIIKQIILEALKSEEVGPEDVPHEEPFVLTDDVIRKSHRFFEKYGTGNFSCPTNDNHWPSVYSRCFIDLKEQTICYRYYQNCKKCETEVRPTYSYEVIEKMAMYAVDSFLIRTGRKEKEEKGGYQNRQIRGEHDETRCEKCKSGQRCR